MSAERQTAYRFSDGVHWRACLFSQEDSTALDAGEGVRPIAPFDRAVGVGEPSPARAPVVTRAGEVLWSNGRETLFRLAPLEDEPDAHPAAESLARADRILATPSGLWVIGPSRKTLECFDEATLARLRINEMADDSIIDIADPGDGSVLALVKREAAWLCRRVAPSGRILQTIPLEGLEAPKALVALRGDDPKIVILDGGPFERLSWYSKEGGPPARRIPIAGMRPCFKAHALGGDGRDRVLLAGVEGAGSDLRGRLVIYNAAGDRRGDAPLDARDLTFTGVAGGRRDVFVTGPGGLARLRVVERVPIGGGEICCALATPALFSRDREDQRRWLRAEATAELPQGTTLEITWAATDDDAVRNRVQDVLADASIPAAGRIDRLLDAPELRRGRMIFQGSDRTDANASKVFAARLFDVRERHLWIIVKLTAGNGARLPTLKELAVLYPGHTLMEELPAIYQRQEENPAGFLRSLVGVLETTTQSLDARIASLGRRLNPSSAPAEWLDFVARWLGVPWDDELSDDQKRAVLGRSAELLQYRGTRRGLETLLGCLFPGPGSRFRVIDATADYGFAVLGGGARPGSRLPALLSGAPPRPTKLDGMASLDSTFLSDRGDADDARSALGGIRVDVAATPKERVAWSPWLADVLGAMTPLTAWLDLRWVGPDALRMDRLDEGMILEAPRAPVLDSGAAVDRVRLPSNGTELSTTGRPLGGRLSLPGSDPHES